MAMLSNYALRGLAVEAKNSTLNAMGRRHKADLAREDAAWLPAERRKCGMPRWRIYGRPPVRYSGCR
jgi:hypothetical protein